jgi:hypothetical protein
VPPPWEREGPVVQRYIDTAKGVLTEPGSFFRTMRRDGGLGPPLIYAIIGVVIGSIGSYVSQVMLPVGSYGMPRGFFFGLLMVPIFAVAGLFIGAAILHVLLLLIAGTRQPFETTMRVVAYTSGSTSPINIVPFVGGIISGVWALAVLIVGSAEAHEVPLAKAAIAVVLPAVICCVLMFLVGATIMALIFGAAAGGFR